MHLPPRVARTPHQGSGRRSVSLGVRVLAVAAGAVVAAGGVPAWAASGHARASEAVAARSAAAPVTTTGQLVVKLSPGVTIDRVNRQLGSRTHSAVLASRSIYLLDVPLESVESDPAKRDKEWKKQASKLIKGLEKAGSVVYAEVNNLADATDGERFYYWPSGGPSCGAEDPSRYRTQPAASDLSLAAIHPHAVGAGAVVAVLDTGAVLEHPELAARLAPGGYDYVDDDAIPQEVGDGLDQDGDALVDEGYGHGTFVAGVVALVAPGATILPQRVLDSDGRGNVFTVAEAVYDSIGHGADVINMSFGTADKMESKIVSEALKAAAKAGVVVVAAAGNDGSKAKHYPAAVDKVISVGALGTDGAALATFSARGDWVDVAAPGVGIISALPCGFGSWSGTSMAAPFVAGAAALQSGVGGEPKRDKRSENIKKSAKKVKGLDVHDGVVDLGRLLDVP